VRTSRPALTESAPTETDRTKPIDRRLFGLAEGARRFLWVTIAFGIASAIAVIAGAIVLARIINDIFLGGAAPGELVGAFIVLAVVYAARGAFEWGRSVAAHRSAATVKRSLRERVMRSVLSQTAGGRPSGSGDLALTASTGIDALDAYFSHYLPQLVLGALVPLLAIVWIATVDPLTVVVIVVTIPLIPVFMWLIGAQADRATRSRWLTMRRLGNGLVETLRGLLTLEVYRAGEGRLDRVRRLSDEYRKQTMGTLRVAFLSAFVLELVATISVAVIAVAIGLRVVQGTLDFEPAMAILILAPEVYAPMRKAGSEFHAAMDGMEAARSMFEVLESDPGGVDAALREIVPVPSVAVGASLIEFSGVSYEYPPLNGSPEVTVLDDVDLRVGRGEHIAVIGPSGAGKSTLIRLILRFGRPTEGVIRIGEVPLDSLDPSAWRSEIGWVGQDPFLVAGTIVDNVRLGRADASTDDVAAALTLVGGGDLIPRLEEVIGERGVGLSHGQRRMVTLARAILPDPSILLLDEPTAGIDTDTQLRIAESFGRIVAGRTVITVAHQRVLVDLADRVIVVDGGRIVARPDEDRR
jgi:thiol reductant ABC exporter CydD subunit